MDWNYYGITAIGFEYGGVETLASSWEISKECFNKYATNRVMKATN